MRRFKYRALAKAPVWDWGSHLKDFKSKCLEPVSETFKWNMVRTANFALMPAWIALEITREQLWIDDATIQTGGKIEPDLAKFDSQRINPEAVVMVNQRIKEWQKTSEEQLLLLRDKIGIDWVENRLYWSQAMSLSIEALYSAVVLESWTAFEILVSDLFYTALDNGPKEWRINTQRKHKEFAGGSNWEPQKVAPTTIHDPQEKYGSSLRDNDTISFRKFRFIKFWFKTAFGTDAEKLFEEVEGGYIRALSAVRNLILHKGGIADATYIKEVQKFEELKDSKENEAIKLDGEIVGKLRSAAIALGRELVAYIDRAIVALESS